jgi:predicted AlkP superfamily pyrophosphatase or phosphodiesterase
MNLLRSFLSVSLITVLCLTICAQQQIRDLKPTVILVSLDGFRYDYLDKYSAPTMARLARGGVRAKSMIPSFPTKTFPNHYTIVTGLYPEHHGIVENNVYDFGEVFTMSKRDQVQNPRWWWGEPIWVTAEKQGQRASSYFWPGSEAKIADTYATHWKNYNGRVPNAMRVDELLHFLDEPVEKRSTFLATYFSTTDDVGHEFGPDARETGYAVEEVDGYIARLMDGLRSRGIDQKANVIIVSDHGMANYYPKQVTLLDDHFDFNDAERILWTSEIQQIFPKRGKLEKIYSKLKSLPHTTCWKKEAVPERLHYNEGRRVAPIVCSSELGWMTTNRKWYDDWFKDLDHPERPRGAHGYDNRYPEMGATFIAHGEAFKRGFVAEPFSNVEVYNIICRILGLKPAKNDGDLSRVQEMLR